jgi:hypothetical protein
MKKLLALAAAAAVSAGTAHAAPTINYVTDPDGSFSANFNNAPGNTSFSDMFTSFVVGSLGGSLSGTLSTTGLVASTDVDFGLAEILGPDGFDQLFTIVKSPLTGKVSGKTVTNPDGVEIGTIGGIDLDPGTYTLHVLGKSGSAATYAGTLSYVAASAPEPAAWGLMIMGFGAIGFAMRRSRNTRYALAYS